jgi:hypothetical protein
MNAKVSNAFFSRSHGRLLSASCIGQLVNKRNCVHWLPPRKLARLTQLHALRHGAFVPRVIIRSNQFLRRLACANGCLTHISSGFIFQLWTSACTPLCCPLYHQEVQEVWEILYCLDISGQTASNKNTVSSDIYADASVDRFSFELRER